MFESDESFGLRELSWIASAEVVACSVLRVLMVSFWVSIRALSSSMSLSTFCTLTSLAFRSSMVFSSWLTLIDCWAWSWVRAVLSCLRESRSCSNFLWAVRIWVSVLPWEARVSAWPARVRVVFWLSVEKLSNLFSIPKMLFRMKFSNSLEVDMEFLREGGWAFAANVLKCDMLSGTEGDPITVGDISLLLLGFRFWLWIGDIGVAVEGLGCKVGFIKLGAKS